MIFKSIISDNRNFRKTLELEGFNALVAQVAESKKVDVNAVVDKLNSVSGPSTAGTTVKINRLEFAITFYF